MPTTVKKHDADADEAHFDPDTARWRRGRRAGKTTPLPLRVLREGIRRTQVDVASASGITQGEVSKLEARDLETTSVAVIRRYIEALGAKLELVATFPAGHRMGISTTPPVLEEESRPRPRARRRA
jgi:hypothetical protein